MDQLWLAIVQWLHTVGLHVDAGAARSVAEGAARATAQLDMPSLLALAAAPASTCSPTVWSHWTMASQSWSMVVQAYR